MRMHVKPIVLAHLILVRSDAPIERLTLIPYGSAKLRITAFLVLSSTP